jgi:superfamily II DNA or RNA helicase
MQLRPYQVEAVGAIRRALLTTRQALLVLATGGGKTVVFSEVIRLMGGKVIVAAHRHDLLIQAKNKILEALPDADIGLVGFGHHQWGHAITIASVASLSEHPERLRDITGIVVDEAQHSAARSWKKVMNALPTDAWRLGVTATPGRLDGKDIRQLFGQPVYQYLLADMIQAGHLCPLQGIQIVTQSQLDSVLVDFTGDYAENLLAQALNTRQRNSTVVQAYKSQALGRSALCFAIDIAHAEALAEAFNESGVPAAVVHSKLDKELVKKRKTDYASGAILVLVNVALLTEGFDSPHTSVIILARPTLSLSLYLQMVGRGTRLFLGKLNCLILDITDNMERHDLAHPVTLAEALDPEKRLRGIQGIPRQKEALPDVVEEVVHYVPKEFFRPLTFWERIWKIFGRRKAA